MTRNRFLIHLTVDTQNAPNQSRMSIVLWYRYRPRSIPRYRSILWCNRFPIVLVIYCPISESESDEGGRRFPQGYVLGGGTNMKRVTLLLVGVATLAGILVFTTTRSRN